MIFDTRFQSGACYNDVMMVENQNLETPAKHNWANWIIAILLGSAVVLIGVALCVAISRRLSDLSASSDPSPLTLPLLSGQTNNQTTVNYYPYTRRVDDNYLSDTLVFITEESPHQILLINSNRQQMGKSVFAQSSNVNFFDGQVWRRADDDTLTSQAEVASDSVITAWQIGIEQSRVTGEIISGQAIVDGWSINFATDRLENEMTVRSWPGYTKFLSSSHGTITISGRTMAAKVAYTQIYSMNTDEIQFANTHLPLESMYAMFWDEAGNFYHIDVTDVDTPTPVYDSHRLGIWKNPAGQITRIDQVDLDLDQKVPPTHYHAVLPLPIVSQLELNTINSLPKSNRANTHWYLQLVEGTATHDGHQHEGFGYLEYIKEW